ncbi:hypothetical protein ACOMHN_025137 [Nucella lapillus]
MADLTTALYSSLPPSTGSDILADATMITSKNTMEKKYEDFTEVKVAVLIDRIYIPVVVVLGVMGNVLSFLTLVFSPLRNTSTCVYMAAIAVLDTVILVLDLCVLLRGYMGHTRFYLSNDWACGFHNFLFYFAIHFDVLLLLAMTVDRFIVVKFPLKAPRMCTSKSAVKATAIIGVFSFLLNIQIFFTRRLGESGNPDDPLKCWYPDPNVDYFMKKFYTWIDASIYSFVPCFSLLILNVLIIRQLRTSRKFSRQFTETRTRKNASGMKASSEENVNSEVETSVSDVNCSEDFGTNSTTKLPDKVFSNISSAADRRNGVFTISKKERGKSGTASVKRKMAANTNITVMFLLVSFTFLLLTSPVVIVLLVKRYYWLPSTAAERAQARLTHAVVDNFMYTNHAVNFLLYCVSGARFRQELNRLLAAMCCRR